MPLQVFSISQGMSIRPVATLYHSSRPVVSLASTFQSRRGGWAQDIGCELISCDDEGSLRVWQAHSSSSYLEAGVSMQAKAPCVSLAVRKGFVIAGGTDGCVRIYNLVRCLGVTTAACDAAGGTACIPTCTCWLAMCAEDRAAAA
jgi:WD40 repeat protein